MAQMAAPLPPLSAREPRRRYVQDMTVEEMEEAVRGNPLRRPPPSEARPAGAPQTARGLLEENRQLIEEKRQQKAMQKKSSREEFAQYLERNRATMENEKSQAITRRFAQKELAEYYKTKIGEKEEARANAYSEKLAGASSGQHWPFSEGDSINRERGEKSRALHEEMQGFMEKQRQAKPPRTEFDPLVVRHPAKAGHSLQYPVSPRDGLPALVPAPKGTATEQWDPSKDSHINRYPRFLQRAAKPSGRRPEQEGKAAKTLEDKVMQTKRELEATSARLVAEQLESQDGLLVNDALKYDKDRAKAAERRRNAQYLQAQMEEKKARSQREAADAQGKCIGYYGPEEKPLQDTSVAKEHCGELIKQMEIDQKRKNVEKGTNIREERQMVRNAMKEMVKERSRDKRRAQEERSVLTQTWGNQQKIIEVKKRLAAQ